MGDAVAVLNAAEMVTASRAPVARERATLALTVLFVAS
jgi:hypothetical protein